MLEIMKAKAKKYKNQYGKDTPVFTADEVLALIYEIEDNKSLGVYALKGKLEPTQDLLEMILGILF